MPVLKFVRSFRYTCIKCKKKRRKSVTISYITLPSHDRYPYTNLKKHLEGEVVVALNKARNGFNRICFTCQRKGRHDR